MEDKTKLILEDFLNVTLSIDRDNPFVDQNELNRAMLRYSSLYKDFDIGFSEFFAYFHYKLNRLFEFWNSKYSYKLGGHFNADQSRELIKLIDHYNDISIGLKNSADEIQISEKYLMTMEKIYPLLRNSGGSLIPPDFGKIKIIKHDPIFTLIKTATGIINIDRSYKLTVLGEGSYAVVKKYFDQIYKRWFAIKQAKEDLTEKELLRFRREYDVLAKINFPYILEVFDYNENNHSYTMEFCEFNLKDYINVNNQKLSLTSRKKIALQFLYGVNYLYKKKYFHRDLSWNNVLIKQYDCGVVFVKISDFGLVKEENSDLTDTETSGKGSTFHKDPLLESFKEIKIENEIYSVGCVINFIFTGRQNLSRTAKTSALTEIIDKCTDNRSLDNRYHSILDIISDVKKRID